MAYRILVAEDDIDIANLITIYLRSSGYTALVCSNGAEAVSLAETEDVDLVLMDIMMPMMDGITAAKKIRELEKTMPIIFLTAKTDDLDKIMGLDAGADDYITKPFNPLELIARVRAQLRRAYEFDKNEEDNEIISGNLKIDKNAMSVIKGDQVIPVTITEYKILTFLMSEPGNVFTKQQICKAVYGENYIESDENSMIVHISKIRSKIEEDPKNPEYIINVRGLGYKIEKQS